MSPDDPNEPLEEADTEEREEAARLALALEGRSVREVPEEALEAALLLRVMEDGELSSERAAAILEELERTAPGQTERTRRLPWPWLVTALGMCALGVVIGLDRLGSSAPPRAAFLPEPSIELLASQATRFDGPETAEYRMRMAEYRERVFASLRGGDR